MVEPLVAIDGLARRLGPRAMVSNVSFTLGPGEMVGLVGANGGGKTTTLRMLAGLLRPDAGRGQVLGMPVLGRQRPWHLLGYMAQKTALYGELTVFENLRFRCEAFALARGSAILAERAMAAGLEPVLGTRVAHLSGGWAKRVQFVAATLHAPRLLLLDEPTAGLDAVTRRELWSWIERFAEQGSAVVISTHDLAEAARLERIVLYRDGTAQAPCAPDELLAATGSASLEEAVIKLAGRT